MRLRLLERRERDERGAIAVMTALLVVVLLAVAALGVDITSQVNQRQKLHDATDAAAHAGAYRLPVGDAKLDAEIFASKNDSTAPVPTVDLFCVVASVSGVPDTSQIPATCNPASKKSGTTYTGVVCNSKICSIPCSSSPSPVAPATVRDVCNTIRVTNTKDVPFAFGPAIGIDKGSTGSVTSVACKGSCGTTAPNPMDVAIVADRTLSMDDSDVAAMISGIKSMLQVMTPSQQYVALGTIGRSKKDPAATTCTGSSKARSQPATIDTTMRDGNPQKPSIDHETIATGGGPWMPEAFSNNYLLPTGMTNPGSTLVSAIDCLKNRNSYTHLAAPMKSAARLLLGKPPTAEETANNIGSLPTRASTPTPQKVIIFETDGEPYESGGSTLANAPTVGTPNLDDSFDMYSNNMHTMSVGSGVAKRYYFNGGHEACQNLIKQAKAAKDAGILVITIAYNLGGQKCDDSDHTYLTPNTQNGTSAAKAYNYSRYATPSPVLNILAAAASKKSSGDDSAADSDCSNTSERTAENTDGDYFFCAAGGPEMRSIFATAFGQVATGIRLIQLP